MAFHAGVGWARGGLLGVDVFFVLSGYLVTSLLLTEHHRTGRISLRRFWTRRARRLLPALAVLFSGVYAYGRWTTSGIGPAQMRGNALTTLIYGANWHYILSGQDYFVRYGALSPLLHTWSLAVEEQFYLVWPIVAVVVLRAFGRRGLGWVAGAGAVASAATCAGLYLAGAGVDRLYYGTDTRIQSLMVGALLAVALSGRRPAAGPARVFGVLGAAGLAGLAVAFYTVDGRGGFLYLGGFLAVALAAAAAVSMAVAAPHSHISRMLSLAPLRYVGRISYGLYLYHWPLFLVLNSSRTGLSTGPLLVVRFAATFAAAALSYGWIEVPARTGVLPRHRGRVVPVKRRRVLPSVATAVAVVPVGMLLSSGTGSPAVDVAARWRPAPGYVTTAGADASHPERVLLLGDSMAVTLAIGLGRDAEAWGATVDNQGEIGCDLDPGTTVDVMGMVGPAAVGCPDWRAQWAALVNRTDPDVVAVLLGRFESVDRLWDGRWTHVGRAAYDHYLQTELRAIIDIASSHGAAVAFLTLPYIAETTSQPNGAPWDMNLPSRTDAFNADVQAAVAAAPGRATVIDLNRSLDPAGHYVSYIDGVRVRDVDAEHVSPAGGEWLQPRLLPALTSLGAVHYRARTPAMSPSGPLEATGTLQP
jgi:peptidoglycan/LPS O-acetylase OafA/YrhL